MSSNIPKLLVVSKTIFHALNNCDEKLCSFVKNYNVVLPHTLAIECVISEPGKKPDKDPEKLISGLYMAAKAGAKLGYQTPELLRIERSTQRPVESVVDEEKTQQYKNTSPEINKHAIIQAANSYKSVTQRKLDEFLDFARRMYNDISENKACMKGFCRLTQKERFKKWIQCIDKNSFMNNAINVWFGKQISDHADNSWYIWQYTRVWCAYCLDRCFNENVYGNSKRDISNDFYDIEPVLYLLRADGLLTNDQELEVPLAKAAYPQKKVFQVGTSLNASRTVQHLFDEIISKVPVSYKN